MEAMKEYVILTLPLLAVDGWPMAVCICGLGCFFSSSPSFIHKDLRFHGHNEKTGKKLFDLEISATTNKLLTH